MADPWRVVLAAAGLAVATACSGGTATETSAAAGPFPTGAIAVPANADLAVGAGRLLVGVAGEGGGRLGSPEHGVTLTVGPLDGAGAGGSQVRRAEFAWMVPDVVGIYYAEFDFHVPGPWAVVVEPDGGAALQPSGFVVKEEAATPVPGEPAPVVETPTLAGHTFEELTTDRQPDPRFYELSLAEALASGRRTVLVFSTPALCQTAACGPMLQTVKDLAPDYPEVNFLHVEVYTDLQSPDFAPDAAHLAPAVRAEHWNLPSEPWVFVIDAAGLVQARFEGVIAAPELASLLG